jgi:Sulfatase-modifying factor enzyme 1
MPRQLSFRVFLATGFALGVVALGAVVLRLATSEGAAANVGDTPVFKPRQLAHTWHQVNGKHWQIVSDLREPPEETDSREGNRGSCGVGMVEIAGKMKQDPPHKQISLLMKDPQRVEEMQKTTCTNWINKEFPERCQTFDRDQWLAISASLPTKDMHFCMDRFEYPNQKGEYPVIEVSWYEARDLCGEMGKRLCTEDEWTFSCEGEEATPYPYGYERSPETCVSDKMWKPYNDNALKFRETPAAMAELDKLWQGYPSGAQTKCKSSFGVYDLTGNIDEWTTSVHEGERPSILKGGYWGPVRTRCRPATRAHDQNHAFYQQGFRCCSDPGATVKPPVDPPGAVGDMGAGGIDEGSPLESVADRIKNKDLGSPAP